MERIFSMMWRLLGVRHSQHQRNFKFANLPAELRCMIYKEVMAEGFWHYYASGPDFNYRTILLRRDCPPELFRAAKRILFEAVNATIGDTAEIEVSWKGVSTNFPLQDALMGPVRHVLDPKARTVDDCTIQLPRCKRIRVKILLPPRELSLYMRTRRNVTKVVEWLNRGDPKQSPALEVRFKSYRPRLVVWNEVVTLIGPLSRLMRRYAPVTIVRDMGCIHGNRFKEHCDIMENFLNSKDADAGRILEYQQSMLEVRLPVMHLRQRIAYMQAFKWGLRHGLSRPEEVPHQVDEATIVHLVTGLIRLQEWCETYEVDPPQWLYSLRWTIGSGELTTTNVNRLLREVLFPGATKQYESWAVGTLTDFNPFEVSEAIIAAG